MYLIDCLYNWYAFVGSSLDFSGRFYVCMSPGLFLATDFLKSMLVLAKKCKAKDSAVTVCPTLQSLWDYGTWVGGRNRNTMEHGCSSSGLYQSSGSSQVPCAQGEEGSPPVDCGPHENWISYLYNQYRVLPFVRGLGCSISLVM